MTAREKAVSTAKAWLGRRESDGSFKTIIDTYNSISPLPRGYRMTYSDPWCAAFVSAVGARCGLSDIILPECGCEPMIQLYKNAGRWVEDDAYKPEPGDIVFYDWQDTGKGDNKGEADHVGIVADVNDTTFTVIEGNKSDSVAYRTISRNGRYIRGFACPDYASEAGEEAPELPVEDKPDEGTAVVIDHTQESVVKPGAGAVWISTVRKGDRGETVRSAQLLLIGRGYGCGPWGADADFGDATRSAVCRFQQAKKLTADGVIGPETWSVLIKT